MQAEILTSPSFELDVIGYVSPLSEPSDRPIRKGRQLPERILVAVHQACDVGDLSIASQLLSILDTVVKKQDRGPVGPTRQRLMKAVVSAHERLWHLRHTSEAVGQTFSRGLDLAW